jgi:hypothetical protein
MSGVQVRSRILVVILGEAKDLQDEILRSLRSLRMTTRFLTFEEAAA